MKKVFKQIKCILILQVGKKIKYMQRHSKQNCITKSSNMQAVQVTLSGNNDDDDDVVVVVVDDDVDGDDDVFTI